MRNDEIPGPDNLVKTEDTRPLTHHPSWPGWIEIVYTCGHIMALRMTDDLPPNCPDQRHTEPPTQSPASIV